MRLSTTLSFYIGRHFLVSFIALFAVFSMLVMTFDVIELMRRASSKPDVSLTMVVEMALLKQPFRSQQLFPFSVLFSGMAVFWRLTRSHELTITRAAGVSAWQFMLPVMVIAALLGVLQVTTINPLSSSTLARYEQLNAIRFKGQSSLLALAGSGLWLRQSTLQDQAVVHATSVAHVGSTVSLTNVTIYVYQGNDHFKRRIQATKAALIDGAWKLTDAWILEPEKPAQFKRQMLFKTDLTLAKIQDSFAPPETMSFWDLPGFIGTLEKAGFSAVRHRLHWHALLAAPLLMCAMVLIAATFTLRQARRGGTAFVIGGGVLTGVSLNFFSDVVFALGLSDSIPVTLAAWTPSGVTMLLGLAMLLHLEDG